MNLNFAFIGVAGYVSPRHLSAINKLGHNLKIAYDVNDNVGILDKFFPKCLFYNDYNKFKHNFRKIKKKINYTVITTPNNTHFKYIKFALINNSNVICEKPLVLSSNHLKEIKKLEKKYKKKVYTILQLRTLKVVKDLKKNKRLIDKNKNYQITINYITPRGHWYKSSWKGNSKKSGGILFNIGIHLLDLVCFLFGQYKKYKIIKKTSSSCVGEVKFDKANLRFKLSINPEDLKVYKDRKVVRDFIINGKKIDLAKNFEKAHYDTYRDIIEYKKFDIETVSNSIILAEKMSK